MIDINVKKEDDKKDRLSFKNKVPNKDNKRKISNLKMKKLKKIIMSKNSNKFNPVQWMRRLT